MANIFKPKDRAATEHRGAIDCVAFSDPAQPVVILRLTDGASVKGPATSDQFTKGTIYRFLGRWRDNEKHGPQFIFDTFIIHAAHGRAGVIKYLTEACDGIGAKTAARIYEKFRGDAVTTLRNDPAAVATACNLEVGLCEIAAIQLASNARFEDTRIELFTLFAGRGFHGKLIEATITKWGIRAPQVIRRNPFAMLGLPSAGFKRCDKLWSDLGLPKDSLKRQTLCACNEIRLERNGDTWVRAADLAAKLREVGRTADPLRAFKLGLRSRKLKKYKDGTGEIWLATYHRATSEERIAAALVRLSAAPCLWPTDRVPVSQEEGDRLPSLHQVDRLRLATEGPVGMLLGGPGTGKTHSLAYLLREVIKEHGQHAVKVCCPTGKAAVRATQALELAGLNLTAATIHSTLAIGRNGHDGEGWQFDHNRRNPLPYQFVVVDETSMVDADLMADLLDALYPPSYVPARPAVPERTFTIGQTLPPRCRRCHRELTHPESLLIGYGPECMKRVDPEDYAPVELEEATQTVIFPAIPEQPAIHLPGAQVLFVGDPYQLPPVGHGAPLRDMIAALVPHGELTEVRRNAGQIVHACVRIKNGESFETCDKVELEPADGGPPKNLKLIEARDEKHAREQLVKALNRLREKKDRGESGGFDPAWQTQVIVARNAKGEICRKRLNEMLHPMLNPDGYAVPGNPFKVGDKIICTRNSRMQQVEAIYTPGFEVTDSLAKLAENYDTVRDPDNQPLELYVANGEIGRVTAVAAKLTVARFSEGDSLVKIPMGKQRDEDEGEGGEDGGDGGRGCNFDHAYAVTCHKMQGSESPCVIVMGDDQAGQLTTREWLYTAISRASKLCVLIGKMSTFGKMKDRRLLNKRKTFLRELILETKYAEL